MTDQERLEEIEAEFDWNVKQGNALPISHSDTIWLFEQAKKAQELERLLIQSDERITIASGRFARLQEALDTIRRIAADPIFRFYAAPRSKQEILMIAEQALKESREG